MNNPAFLGSAMLLAAALPLAADEPPKLDGYNYVITWDKGQIANVRISGENGSGLGLGLFSYDEKAPPSDHYKHLPPGSAVAVSLPTDRLLSMQPGQKLALNLPGQTVTFVQDNRFVHGNGDVTWVAHTEKAKELRALLTVAQSGAVLGEIDTGSNRYLLESRGGRSYLVDLNKSGLTPAAMDGDTVYTASGGSTIPPGTAGSSAMVTLDLLVLHTPGLSEAAARVNHLVALTNQAYLDSGINVQLRLVGLKSVKYRERNPNTRALNDLTDSLGRLSRAAGLRNRYGADLVSLVRPFYKTAQGSCGGAWINGARGSRPRARLSFSVVSDGIDHLGAAYFCNNYALAHEIGHNLGSAHDHDHSPSFGAFDFSFGYQTPLNGYGTIMSYYNSRIGYFSNPNIDCFGEPCGVDGFADNARSFGLIAPAVAAFKPTVVP